MTDELTPEDYAAAEAESARQDAEGDVACSEEEPLEEDPE